MQTSFRASESIAVKATPALVTLLVTFLTYIPSHVLGSGEATPAFTLVCIFYWCVYSPQALPYTFLFLLGVLEDALSGTPLGISSFIHLGVAYLVQSQRRLMGRAMFATVWMSGAVLLLIALLSQWLMMCVYTGKAYGMSAALLRWAVTALTYPLMHLLLTQVYKRLRGT